MKRRLLEIWRASGESEPISASNGGWLVTEPSAASAAARDDEGVDFGAVRVPDNGAQFGGRRVDARDLILADDEQMVFVRHVGARAACTRTDACGRRSRDRRRRVGRVDPGGVPVGEPSPVAADASRPRGTAPSARAARSANARGSHASSAARYGTSCDSGRRRRSCRRACLRRCRARAGARVRRRARSRTGRRRWARSRRAAARTARAARDCRARTSAASYARGPPASARSQLRNSCSSLSIQ